jgi:hypothetical protein
MGLGIGELALMLFLVLMVHAAYRLPALRKIPAPVRERSTRHR